MSGKQLTRAEIVRQRRAQRAAKEMAQTAQRAVKPVAPVTSRVSTPLTVKSQTRATQPPRHFNIAIGLPHLTLHKPTVHIKGPRGSWRLVSFLIILLLGTALYFAWTLPYFHVPVVMVEGNQRLTRDEINAVSGVQGQSIFAIKPEEIATRVRLNYPELTSAKVDVYLPNYVFVTVTERQPVILWQQGDGYTWIDAAGIAFRPRGEASGLITVTSAVNPPAGVSTTNDPLSPPPFVQKDLVDAILALAPNVPPSSTLTYDATDGLGWKDSRGWEVYFGTSSQDMLLKLRVYQSLVNSLTQQGKTPEYISVVYPDAPYYRMPQTVQQSEVSASSGQ